MRKWLQETHAPEFELLRHFLLRFFDNELIATPGQMTPVLIAITPVAFQWFFLLARPLRNKYVFLSGLATSGPYREALRADELWLITLMMSVIGLLTAIRWQSLFPDLRDYRILGALPLRPRQIFAAKLAALLIVAAAALVAVNLLPSMGFPFLSTSRWSFDMSLSLRIRAHAVASIAASAFVFFGLVALQGVLLNLLPPRVFARITGYLQGGFVAMMLGSAVLSFSVSPPVVNTVLDPRWAPWVPPVWFLGMDQSLSGDPDSVMAALAYRGKAALLTVSIVALLSHLISYQRHRILLVEGLSSSRARDTRWKGRLLSWVIPDPRQQAVVVFMMNTLKRSSYHRMIFMGYAGLWFAIVWTGIIEMGTVIEASRVAPADFVYFHLVTLLFLLIGTRHGFSLPTEWKANWIFQISEREGRSAWLTAMDRFVLFWGAGFMLVVPMPFEVRVLGRRAAAEVILFAALYFCAYQWTFFSWDKMPFTCSHLPNKTPIGMILAFFGLAGVVAALHSFLLSILFKPILLCVVIGGLLVASVLIQRRRRRAWAYLRLKFDEVPEPVVCGLNLS